MKYTKELQDILFSLLKEPSSGIIDVVIEILRKYYNNPKNVEDLTMVIFLNKYYPGAEKLGALIDKLIQFQSVYQNESESVFGEVLEKAEEYAKKYLQIRDVQMVSSSHFLLAALDKIPDLSKTMKQCGAGKEELEEISQDNIEYFQRLSDKAMEIIEKIFPKSLFNPVNQEEGEVEGDSFMESMGFPLPDGEVSGTKKTGNSKTPLLDKYSRELTSPDTVLDPVYGRESELTQLLEILGCKKKNNAILIGEPGVGKTSVVELLAQRIRDQKVPRQFLGRRIFSLDLNSLVAGTKYRGQYEERLQGVIKEVISNPGLIVFIDEIHNLIGNGGSDGNGDAANILKPYLAKGVFQCIGSTTFKEYRKYIEKDGALKRRFQKVTVDEPGADETKVILQNIKTGFEAHHGVTYPKEIIEACVGMAARYFPDRYFPDKAIDLLDLSGSLARLTQEEGKTDYYLDLSRKADNLRDQKIESVKKISLPEALKYRDQERKIREKMMVPSRNIKVTLENVYQAVGKRSGVPLEKIGSSDLDKLRDLAKILPTRVIGQEGAIKEVIMSLQKNSLGIRDPQKPIASLLFVGPTGSGKTYLCKTLAREFFGSENSLIKFDMSEYGEKHEITKLTGAAASYVGYDDEPGFEMIRKHPYSVVLFDEIEKAAPEIYQIFLSILDEGQVTLGNGVKVNFKNTIIIFTGNIGTKELSLFGGGLGYGSTPGGPIGKDKKDSIVKKAIEKTFAPEFINRLSRTIIFESLGKPELTKIIDLELTRLSDRLKESKITFRVTKALKEYIISQTDPKYGARDLQRGISKHVEEMICQKLLEDGGKSFAIDYKNGEVKIEAKTRKKKSDGNKLLCPPENREEGEKEPTPKA